MTIILLAVCIYAAAITVCYFSRKECEPHQRLDKGKAKEVALWFLKKEYRRHMKDMIMIQKDIMKLEKEGIKAPNVDLDTWIDV